MCVLYRVINIGNYMFPRRFFKSVTWKAAFHVPSLQCTDANTCFYVASLQRSDVNTCFLVAYLHMWCEKWTFYVAFLRMRDAKPTFYVGYLDKRRDKSTFHIAFLCDVKSGLFTSLVLTSLIKATWKTLKKRRERVFL